MQKSRWAAIQSRFILVSHNLNKYQNGLYPLALLAVGGLAYLLQAGSLGFYWDDWQAVYLYYTRNFNLLDAYFAYDRPFSAWTYHLAFPLLGMSPVAWQIFSVLIRWLGVLFFVKTIQMVWPRQIILFQWTGFLLMVYPGFDLQFVSLAFSQHFMTFLVFTFSLWLHVQSLKSRSAQLILYILALLFTGLHLFSMEYFVGLELIRPFLIWNFYRSMTPGFSRQAILVQLFKNWLPFGLVFGLYLGWRFMIFPTTAPAPLENQLLLLNQIVSSPFQKSFELLSHVIQDELHAFLFVWLEPLKPENLNFGAKTTFISFGIGLAASLVALSVSSRPSNKNDPQNEAKHPLRNILVLGLAAVLFGSAPFWLAGRQIIVGKWSERFSLAPMVGIVLLCVIFIDWFAAGPKKRNLLLAFLVITSTAFQVQTGSRFSLDWANQRDFYWQLLWRVPSLANNTAILSSYIPTGMESDYSTGFGIATLYGSDTVGERAPYWFYTPRSLGTAMTEFKVGLPISSAFRNIQFQGSTSQVVPIAYNPGDRCLRILDPLYITDPNLSDENAGLFELYNPSTIQPELRSVSELPGWLGREPVHTWCYYYQKADFARQNQDWQAAIDWTRQAFSKGHFPKAGAELMPIIVASAALNDWETSAQYLRGAADLDQPDQGYLCTVWNILKKLSTYSDQATAAIGEALLPLNCQAK